jgi:hypothetical protein
MCRFASANDGAAQTTVSGTISYRRVYVSKFFPEGMTLLRSIADAHAMDRLNEGSWGNDPVGHGRLAAVVMDGILTDCARRLFDHTLTALYPHRMHWIILGNKPSV